MERWFGKAALALAVAGSLLAAQPGRLRAEDSQDRLMNLGSDKFKILPTFNTMIEYDSNIARAPRGRTADMITHFSPGVSFTYDPSPTVSWDANYTLRGNVFADNGDQDSTEHFAGTDARWNPGPMHINVDARVEKTESPIDLTRSVENVGTQFSDRLSVEQYSMGIALGFDLHTFGVELAYHRDQFNVLQGDFADFNHHVDTFLVNGTYHLTAKTDLIGNFTYSDTEFEHGFKNNYTAWEATVGVRGQVTEKLQVLARIGTRSAQFDFDEAGAVAQNRSPDDEEFSDVVAVGSANYQLTAKDNVAFTYLREQINSVRSNFILVNRVSLDWSHTIDDKWSTTAGGFYSNEDESLEDTVLLGLPFEGAADTESIGLTAGASYAFRKWWIFDLNYAFEAKYSRDNNRQFDDNRVMVSTTVNF